MPVVQSLGRLADMELGWSPAMLYGSVRLYDQYSYDYATLYRTQPNIRTCVDFLARNIAQLGLHVFRRVSDTDRQRLTDHGLAQVIEKPLPPEFKVTYYRLIESLMADMGIYFNAFWLKVKREGAPLGLLRVPPTMITPLGGMVPLGYEINLGGQVLKVAPNELVHFRGYNPDNALWGLSPLETLRRVLAEEHAMGDYREHFWQNAARMGGIIERPADAPDWSPEAKARFKAEWEALTSGGANSGKTAVLQDGMTWKEASFNAQQSEYLGGRKLTREECARAYHIPLPMVGILDHATFSNIKEQHKNLYQDALGPWLAMIEQDIELQLLPEFEDTEGVYTEFNIAEKMQGSFEEQTTALQSAVGRPWMTANEARARMNLPSLPDDADQLVTPLNVLVGGQASPRDSAPPKALLVATKAAGEGELDSTLPTVRVQHEKRWAEVLGRYFRRQESAVVSRLPKGKAQLADIWPDTERWNNELAADILRLNKLTAGAWARHMAELAGGELDEDRMLAWLGENARIAAEEINAHTQNEVADALVEATPRDAVRDVFAIAATSRLLQIVRSKVTTASNFGAHEGAKQSGLKTKTWQVNSGNPRSLHASLNGVTVGIGELFPGVNMMWPGDPAGGADNNSNCVCSVRFGR